MAVNKYTEARRRANEKYNAKAYEEIKVRVYTGKKSKVKAHAETQGESLCRLVAAIAEELPEPKKRAKR